MEIKCKKCGYKWDTKTELIMVSCPSCGTKNRVREINEGEKDDTENKTDM